MAQLVQDQGKWYSKLSPAEGGTMRPLTDEEAQQVTFGRLSLGTTPAGPVATPTSSFGQPIQGISNTGMYAGVNPSILGLNPSGPVLPSQLLLSTYQPQPAVPQGAQPAVSSAALPSQPTASTGPGTLAEQMAKVQALLAQGQQSGWNTVFGGPAPDTSFLPADMLRVNPSVPQGSVPTTPGQPAPIGTPTGPKLGYGTPQYSDPTQAAAGAANDQRVAQDSAYRQSEIRRARMVLANQQQYGLSTGDALTYLNKLLAMEGLPPESAQPQPVPGPQPQPAPGQPGAQPPPAPGGQPQPNAPVGSAYQPYQPGAMQATPTTVPQAGQDLAPLQPAAPGDMQGAARNIQAAVAKLSPEQQQQVTANNQQFASSVDQTLTQIGSMLTQARQSPEAAVMVNQWLGQAEVGMAQLQEQVQNQIRSIMGQDDPSVQAAIDVIREEVARQKQELGADLNARGLMQSGILLDLESKLKKNELTQIQQVVSERLSRMNDMLIQSITSFAQARAGLLGQAFGATAQAYDAAQGRRQQAEMAGVEGYGAVAGMRQQQAQFTQGLSAEEAQQQANRAQQASGLNAQLGTQRDISQAEIGARAEEGRQGRAQAREGQTQQLTFQAAEGAANRQQQLQLTQEEIAARERLTLEEVAGRERIARSDISSREGVAAKEEALRRELSTAENALREKLTLTELSSREGIASADRANRIDVTKLDIASREAMASMERSFQAVMTAGKQGAEGIQAQLDRESRERIAAIGKTDAKLAAEMQLALDTIENKIRPSLIAGISIEAWEKAINDDPNLSLEVRSMYLRELAFAKVVKGATDKGSGSKTGSSSGPPAPIGNAAVDATRQASYRAQQEAQRTQEGKDYTELQAIENEIRATTAAPSRTGVFGAELYEYQRQGALRTLYDQANAIRKRLGLQPLELLSGTAPVEVPGSTSGLVPR